MIDPAIQPQGRKEPLLFAELPGLARSVPWMALCHLPTPVVRMSAIADWLGRDDLWMKRDDLVSPLYGGNKIRRYEHVLADALDRGAKCIVTAGGLASTQVTATALFGKALGLPVHAVLFDQPMTTFGRKAMLMDTAAGAELVYGGGFVSTAIRTALALRRHEKSYLILPGAANPLANLGYIDAMLELSEQVKRGEMPRPDAIVLPTGSSGTLAALALGAAYLGWPTEIIGVRITERIACNHFTIGMIARSTASFLEKRDARFSRALRRTARFSLFHGAIGKGYGYPTAEAIDGTRQMERLTGQPGEVTYTGKALAGLRALGREPRWAGKTLLFWNTLSTARPEIPPGTEERLPASLRSFYSGNVPV
jgi:D-cysteine desulfhydrase